MGCGASKEAPVTVAVPPSVAGGTSAATKSNNNQQQVAESALPSTTRTTTAAAPATKQPHQLKTTAAASQNDRTNASMTDQQKAEALKAGLLMVQLNDVVPGSTDGGVNNRGRFLSYASGASTPNTSSGNLSWSDDKASGAGGAGDSDKDSNDDYGGSDGHSPHHSPSRGGRGNPKTLKKSHSGSAIDLENLTRQKSCTLTSKVVHIEVPFGKPIEEVYDGVHNGPVLGSGVSGLVRLVTHRATGIKYAVKCLDLGLVGTKEGLEQLREEIFIMCQLDHPNIVRLEEVYESHSEIYLVQELCLGGELFDRLDEQPDYHYTEAQCARLVKQMLSAVRYLHSKGKRL